jgi:hypothetical protein
VISALERLQRSLEREVRKVKKVTKKITFFLHFKEPRKGSFQRRKKREINKDY